MNFLVRIMCCIGYHYKINFKLLTKKYIIMKKYFALFLLTFLFTNTYASDLSDFNKEVNTFLKKHVSNGLVEYDVVKKNFKEIESIYQKIGSMNISKYSDNEKKVFYINAYNMIVIYQASKFYPLKSPLDQSGFFDKVKHNVAGQRITLNALEIIKLMKKYGDARIHFALACAAKSCPKLAGFAFTPEKLESQLNERTRRSVNNGNFIQVNNAEKEVKVSMIFKWYAHDFEKGGKKILDFINKFRKIKITPTHSLSYYNYDWTLNKQ